MLPQWLRVLFSDNYLNAVRDYSNRKTSSSDQVLLIASALILIIHSSPVRRLAFNALSLFTQKDWCILLIIVDTSALITRANCARRN